MDNSEPFLIGLLVGFFLASILSFGFAIPSFEDDIYKAWCQSDGGRWVDGKCFEEYKEIKLK